MQLGLFDAGAGPSDGEMGAAGWTAQRRVTGGAAEQSAQRRPCQGCHAAPTAVEKGIQVDPTRQPMIGA